jgi:hypothetical protein
MTFDRQRKLIQNNHANLSKKKLACLAAAKTIINEMKQDLSEESPVLWTTQAFSVAAAVSRALAHD